MTDEKLHHLLNDMDIPALDKEKKKQAINLAMTEFNAYQQEQAAVEKMKPQGFWSWLRPTSVFNSVGRRYSMTFLKNKMFYTGMATASVAVVGMLLVLLPGTEWTAVDQENIAETEVLEEEAIVDSLKIDKQVLPSASHKASSLAEPEVLREPLAVAQLGKFSKDSAALPAVSNLAAEQDIGAPAKPSRLSMLAPPEDENSPKHYREQGRDRFEGFLVNPVKQVQQEPVSTFSIDVDTASYSFVRRQLNQGVLPQKDAVRIEEMINYFDYAYPLPEAKQQPFRASVGITNAPWAEDKKLLHIGIRGYDLAPQQRPRSNLVFLLDVSGSMNSPDKLPLVKQSMNLLLSTLQPEDTVGIVVYAGAAGTVLSPTPVKDKQAILNALNRLQAGGSTAGAQGIKLAYQLAEANFDKDAVNRIILATDGDFNVGITNRDELQGFVERKRKQGVFLSVLGFGQGNYHDHMMQTLAQNGNGVATYIDTLGEAQKVLVEEASSTLFPIAKDVKIQVEFNPATVAEYRLIGYETRHLNREDFNNDAVDAGDIGAGHSVTAIYELTPVNATARAIDDTRYGKNNQAIIESEFNNEYAFLKIRYKLPIEDKSKLMTQAITTELESAKNGLQIERQFATAVAAFGQLLKDGKYMGDYHYEDVIKLAQSAKGSDEFGYRAEFIQLVRKAQTAAAMQ